MTICNACSSLQNNCDEVVEYNVKGKEGPVDLKYSLGPRKKYAVVAESNAPPTTKKSSKDTTKREKSFLEPNHSHFLLVDNGTINQSKTEINLRIRLEDKLDTMWENCASMKYYFDFSLPIHSSRY